MLAGNTLTGHYYAQKQKEKAVVQYEFAAAWPNSRDDYGHIKPHSLWYDDINDAVDKRREGQVVVRREIGAPELILGSLKGE